MSGDFNPEQKRYLEGFVAGLQIAKAARGSGGARRQLLPERRLGDTDLREMLERERPRP